MIIQVIDYTKTAFSNADAMVISPLIAQELERTGKVVLDFTGIRFFTTLFFNNSVGKYVLEYGPDEFSERIVLKGLSEVGKDTFQHSFENASKLAALSKEKRAEVIALENDLKSIGEDA